MPLNAIILAAGKGTRMKSSKVKIIHEAAGRAIINHVINNLEEINVRNICLVVGFQSDDVKNTVTSNKVEFVIQKEQRGTGHAVMQTEDYFSNKQGNVLILPGDAPLISSRTLTELYLFHKQNNAKVTVLSTIMPNPTGYGRIMRDKSEQVLKIVEEKDATETEKKVHEINTGIYCIDKDVLFSSLKKVTTNNNQNEYYLTDIIQIARNNGYPVYAYISGNYKEFQGVNSREDLASVTEYLFAQKRLAVMDSGVTLVDPATTYIEPDVSIGQDTIIYPGVYLCGKTSIGSGCTIGAYSVLHCAVVKDDTVIPPHQYINENR